MTFLHRCIIKHDSDEKKAKSLIKSLKSKPFLNINCKDTNRNTCLHLSVQAHLSVCTQVCLRYGASVLIKNNQNHTCLQQL